MRLLYSLAWYLALPLVCLRLWWRGRREPGYREHWGERFARFAPFAADKPKHHGRLIWLHAVSVGETRAAQPLLAALLLEYPDARILLSHMTPTGRATGKNLFAEYGDRIIQSYLPYDTLWFMRRFIRHFRPAICILLETEVWPNLLAACARERLPCALVNARLSERSLKKGLRLGRLMRDAVQCIDLVVAQSGDDAERIRNLGVRKVVVAGNMKFDVTVPPAQLQLGQALRTAMGARPVVLCASMREGEEALLLPELLPMLRPDAVNHPLLLLVPRHPQRFDEVERLVLEHGLHCQRRSALDLNATPGIPDSTQVLLGDSMGEMFAYYFSCDLALIGGSLLPMGGQNLIEACILGKPVLMGPHMFNFAEVSADALKAGAAVAIKDASDAARQMLVLLADGEQARQIGTNGLFFAQRHQGATRATMAFLSTLLP